MKSSKKTAVTLLLLLTAFAFSSSAQKAALYNFDFQVPDEYRKQIQAYDPGGNKKYKKDLFGDNVLDRSPETLSKKEVNAVCALAADMFKRKFGYAQVTMMYPLDGSNGYGRLDNFPNLTFKKATKKLTVDIYIALEIKIESKEPFLQGSDVLEVLGIPDDDKPMIMDISASYTIYNSNEEIIDKKLLTLPDLKDELNAYFKDYTTRVDEKGRFKLWKAYLTKEDITSIYTIAEQKLEALE